MNATLISSIITYGHRYRREFLNEYAPDRLLADSWDALNFFFGRACFQGRRDDVSQKVYNAINTTLSPQLSEGGLVANYNRLKRQQWRTIEGELNKCVGKGKVGKARDIDMVLSTLDFVGQIPSYNMVKYSVERIRCDKIEEHYEELQRSLSARGIVQVGPKIAAFYLRDVISLYSLESQVPADFAYCLQPVDVWVRKLARRTGIVDDNASDHAIQKAIVALCQERRVSSLLFNQGAWYIGYNAFDLVLEMLDKQN
jgi:hypothetical protein